MDLAGFDQFPFASGGIAKTVYRKGEGPAVLLMHELPGMVPECVALAEAIAEAQYTVYLPLFFGKPGERVGLPEMYRQMCVSQEFQALRAGVDRPIANWLRALLAGPIRSERPGPSGAIGMCLTGGFALGMLIDENIVAPVVCQPSLPFAVPVVCGRARREDLGLSPEEMNAARARSDVPILGFRFEGDWISPREKFQTLRSEFGDRFREKQLPGDSHSTLTVHFHRLSPDNRDWVWRTLFDFLNERLKGGQGIVPPQPLPQPKSRSRS